MVPRAAVITSSEMNSAAKTRKVFIPLVIPANWLGDFVLLLGEILLATNRLGDVPHRFLVVVFEVSIYDECRARKLPGGRIKDAGREHYWQARLLSFAGAGNQ